MNKYGDECLWKILVVSLVVDAGSLGDMPLVKIYVILYFQLVAELYVLGNSLYRTTWLRSASIPMSL